MFHCVRIKKEDQQCQRFLWRDADCTREPTVYILQVMAFGPACSPCASQAVKNHQASKYEATHPEAADAIINSTYMDDYFASHSTLVEAIAVTNAAIRIMQEISFNLVSFQSNSLDLLKGLPQDNVKQELVDLPPDLSDPYTAKILGMYWNPRFDTFSYKVNFTHLPAEMTTPEYLPTKRQILSAAMKVYDPTGHVSHILIGGKIVLQKLWRDECDWDDPISPSLLPEWNIWLNHIRSITKIEIPRWYAPLDPSRVPPQLHTFVDASIDAMAATVFIRFQEDEQTYVSQVMAKTRVMPLRTLSIPKAELVAALMGIRLSKCVKSNFTFEVRQSFYWSDSRCVLSWLKSESKRFQSFVAAKVHEILDESTVRQWRYVPTALNPADDGTKWKDTNLMQTSRWFKGPDFLMKPETEWPQNPLIREDELPPDFLGLTIADRSTNPDENAILSLTREISATMMHDWKTLKRIVAYRLRFIQLRLLKKPNSESFLTPTELVRAQTYLFKCIQLQSFSFELDDLKNSRPLQKNSPLYKLSAFIAEDGLIRMSSRLQNAKLTYASRNPVILPKSHPLVLAFVKGFHAYYHHCLDEATISAIRRVAWVIHLRVVLKTIKSQCSYCRERAAKPITPLMAPLPGYRLDTDSKPFTYVGVDCFGPMDVRVRRSSEKRWAMIFVCLVSHAVHIELLAQLSTDACLMAVSNFVNLRGNAKHFYSDRGRNFSGAAKFLDDLGAGASNRFQIHWHFNPAWSPHFGGVWERLIQDVKKCLKAIRECSRSTPAEPTLRCAILEAVNRMNNRPLTYTPTEPEAEEPLTPNFILGLSDCPTLLPEIQSEAAHHSRWNFKRAHHMARIGFARFVKEHLPLMARRGKWFNQQLEIEVGDLVIVPQPNEPREYWKKGLVIHTHPGKDNVTRVVTIRLGPNKEVQRSVANVALMLKGSTSSPQIRGVVNRGSVSSTDI